MKNSVFILASSFIILACGHSQTNQQMAENRVEVSSNSEAVASMNFYDFKVETLSGETFDFSTLKGKRVLIVNTASECGYTPQYKQLQELYDTYGGDKFTIIGFPANNFGGQEPGSDEQIASFCEKNYGVTFPMMSKISVKGSDEHPVYKWLTSKSLNGVSDGNVKWNFHKFLIDENGNWVKELSSSVSPLDDVVVNFAQGK